jgi:hypothetical protein
MTDKLIETALDHLSEAHPSYHHLAPKPTLYHIVRELQNQRKRYLSQLILQALMNKQSTPVEREQYFIIDSHISNADPQDALADKLAERIFDRENSTIRDLVICEQEKKVGPKYLLCYNVDE